MIFEPDRLGEVTLQGWRVPAHERVACLGVNRWSDVISNPTRANCHMWTRRDSCSDRAIRKGGPFLRTGPLLSRLTKVSNPGGLRDIGEGDLEDFNLDVGCPGSFGGIPAKTADL